MANNPIQEQRMKNYFIEATKEIIKSEGIRALSVRNIAQKAGYSYATLYNYFKDIKDLIFECVQDFQEECQAQINEDVKKLHPGKEKITGIVQSYIKFFVQYPGIFDLFYLEKISDIGQEKTTQLITNFLNRLCKDEYEYLINSKTLNSKELGFVKNQINFAVTGMLLFYINRRQPVSYQEFEELSNTQIDLILKKFI